MSSTPVKHRGPREDKEENIVYLNTINPGNNFVSYTNDSLKKGHFDTGSHRMARVREVLARSTSTDPNVRIPISQKFKSVARGVIETSTFGKREKQSMLDDLELSDVDDAFYSKYLVQSPGVQKLEKLLKEDTTHTSKAPEPAKAPGMFGKLKSLFKAEEELKVAQIEEDSAEESEEELTGMHKSQAVKYSTPLGQLEDELRSHFTINGTSPDEISRVMSAIGDSKEKAEEYLLTGIISRNVTAEPDTTKKPSDTEEQTQGQVPTVSEQPGLVINTQSKDRYHPLEITWFFGNKDLPEWDSTLEKQIVSSGLDSSKRIEKMDSVIRAFGDKLGIKQRLSDTLEELNELEQLAFCVMRNLQRGSRFKTASVKLSDLTNLMNGQSPSTTATSTTAQSTSTTSTSTTPMAQTVTNAPIVISKTEAESNFQTVYNTLKTDLAGRNISSVGKINTQRIVFDSDLVTNLASPSNAPIKLKVRTRSRT